MTGYARPAASLGLLMMLAGCATAGYEAPQSGATSQITLHRGALGQREHASLLAYDAQWGHRADVYGGMGYTYDVAKSFAANVPARLEVEMVRNTATAVQQCAYRVRFIPQADHSYDITPTGTCTAVLTDRATGQPPADLTIEPVPADWRPAN